VQEKHFVTSLWQGNSLSELVETYIPSHFTLACSLKVKTSNAPADV
jgi:hypothetical protein